MRRRVLRKRRLREMMCEQLRLLLDGVRIKLLQGARDALMQRLPVVAQQAVIGGVAQQGVGEREHLATSFRIQQIRFHQRRQSALDVRVRQTGDRHEHVAPHRAPYDRRDLRDLLGAARSVQPGHEGFVQRGRYRQVRDLELAFVEFGSAGSCSSERATASI